LERLVERLVGDGDGRQLVVPNVHIETLNLLQVEINAFESEDTTHIGRPEVTQILADCMLDAVGVPARAVSAIRSAAMRIYSDPDRPENITCYQPTSRRNVVLVRGAEGWEVRPASQVLPTMTKRSIDVIFDPRRQPYVEEYRPVLEHIRDHESELLAGRAVRPILERNRQLIREAAGGRSDKAAGSAAGRSDKAAGSAAGRNGSAAGRSGSSKI
jgi:hypothetical protein